MRRKCWILLKYMNLWNDSRRKWGLESESNRKLKKTICIIKLYPIKWITPLTRMDTNNFPPWGESVEFYLNKWISGMIRDGNEVQNPNQNRKLKKTICIIKLYPIKWNTPLTRMDTNNLPPWGESDEFYSNKWIFGVFRKGSAF